MKNILLTLLLFLPVQSFAGDAILDKLEFLSAMLSDYESRLVRGSIEHTKYDEKGLELVTFFIEGFKGGNNYEAYLVVFESSYRKKDVPPFEAFGPPKYRLIGLRHLCFVPTEEFLSGSLKVNNGVIEGVCVKNKVGTSVSRNFEIKVSSYDVTVEY